LLARANALRQRRSRFLGDLMAFALGISTFHAKQRRSPVKGVKRLTQEMYDSIPALLEQGMNKVEIAHRFGVTPSTLVVQCSRRGISLRRGGALGRRVTLTLPESPLELSDAIMIALRNKARSMGIDAVRLARNLLETIVADDLYNAVLDLEETA
jgi:hypothetical protein